MRLILFTVISLLLLSCKQKTAGAKQQKKPKSDTASNTRKDTTKGQTATPKEIDYYTTPDEAVVNKSLQGYFKAEWHVLNDKEGSWMKDAFEYFIVPKRKELPNYPYITMGDFNGDSKPDTAAVVTDSLRTKYRIAVLSSAGKPFLWDEDIMADAAISLQPKGTTLDVMMGENAKKVKLKNDGINVEYFERASFVLHLDKGKFKRLQTSD